MSLFDSVVLLEGEAPSGGSSFIETIFNNIANFCKAAGSYIVLIIGLLLIIMAVYQISKGFLSGGSRSNWFLILGCLLFGGILIFGGWVVMTGDKFGAAGKNTVDSMLSGNTPTSIGDVSSGGGSGSSLDNAQAGIHVLSSAFFVPFGSALATCVGVALIIIAVFQVATFFFGRNQKGLSIPKVLVMAILGSCLFAAAPSGNTDGWIWIRDTIVGATKDGIGNVLDGNSSNQSSGLDVQRLNERGAASTAAADATPPGADPSKIPS